MYPELEERLTSVESALAEFIIQTNKSFRNLHNEMKEFKDEMKGFKDEMKEFKDEVRQDRKDMNKQWGELANKMGTLVEDIIAPAVGPVLEQYFKEEITHIAVNVRRKETAQNLRGEFDIIATSKSRVFLVETKSSPKTQQLQEFTDKVVPRFQQLFPEYSGLKITPVFASLRFDDTFLKPANKLGIYLMAFREWEYMDLLNFDALQGSSK